MQNTEVEEQLEEMLGKVRKTVQETVLHMLASNAYKDPALRHAFMTASTAQAKAEGRIAAALKRIEELTKARRNDGALGASSSINDLEAIRRELEGA